MDWIFKSFGQSRLYRLLLKVPLPQWMVLALDILVILAAWGFLCLYNIFGGGPVPEANAPLWLQPIVLAIVYAVTDITVKSYQRIIRLSVIEDGYRVFMLVVYATAVLIIINVGVDKIFGYQIFRYFDLLLIGVVGFSLLMTMRLLIKYIFIRINSPKSDRIPVIVLGTSINSVILANALKHETSSKYEPVALLHTAEGSTSQSINGLTVERFDADRIADIFARHHSTTLLFLASQIDTIRSTYADVLLQNGITLLRLNQVEEFSEETDGRAGTPTHLSAHINNIQIEDLLGRDPIKTDNPLVKDNIAGQTVLITGAAGSIGSEIVRQVAAFGAKKIILVDQAETPMHNMQLEMKERFPGTDIVLYIADVVNRARMARAFDQYHPAIVYHAAAYKHVPMMEINPTEAIITNVQGTMNLADLALNNKVKKFVMISTDKAVNPSNIMGATKRIAEIYVQSLFFKAQAETKYGQPVTQFITTRFGNVLGSNGSVIPLFRSQIERGGPVTVTHKEIIRYFMTIQEACSLVLEAGCMGNGGEIYIFDMGKPVKIYDLACRMISLAGLRPGKDIQIVETGLRPGEKLYEELLNDKEKTTSTVNHKIMIAKVQRYDYEQVNRYLMAIIRFAQAGDIHSMVKEMKRFVPEYKSMNSQFNAIDAEIAQNK